MISSIIIFLFIVSVFSNCSNVFALIPEASEITETEFDVDGHTFALYPDKDGFDVDSFFDISWTSPIDDEYPSEKIDLSLSDGEKDEKISMDQYGNTELYAEDAKLLKFVIVDNSTSIKIDTGNEGIFFISDASTNDHYIHYEDLAMIRTIMADGIFMYQYWDGSDFGLLYLELTEYEGIKCLYIIDFPHHIYMLQNNTVIVDGMYYGDAFGGYINPFYWITINGYIITLVAQFFDVTINTLTQFAFITLFANTGAINPLFSITLKNLWAWEYGIVDITTFTMFGQLYITYYSTWWWYHYGLLYVFVWSSSNIKIECFWYDYFYVVWNWYWFTLIWWWEDYICWEFKIVIVDWFFVFNIQWTLEIWNFWIEVHYTNWILPVMIIQVPILYIPPIVDIQVYYELYDANTDELNLTYRLVDLYGNPINNAIVDVSVDGVNKSAQYCNDGLYFVSFSQAKKADKWDIVVNATVPNVVLVDKIEYSLDIDEVEIIPCDECPQCPEISTTSWIIIGGSGVAITFIGYLLLRKSKALNLCLGK